MNDDAQTPAQAAPVPPPAPDPSVTKDAATPLPPDPTHVNDTPPVAAPVTSTPPTCTATISIPLDFDPSRATIRFAKPGLAFLLQQRYFLGLSLDEKIGQDQLDNVLDAVEHECSDYLKNSILIEHLNFDDEEESHQAIEILKENQDTLEWWSLIADIFMSIAKEALEANNARRGMWAISVMHAARSMLIFKQSVEQNMWRGYTTALLRPSLDIWATKKDEPDEDFWQKTLTDNALILSQLFAFPVIVLKGKAYLGGKGIDNSGGKLVDFFIANELSENVALVEIKTPKTKLLETSEYRSGVFSVSKELTGAVNQVLTYKDTLAREYLIIQHNSATKFHAFNPQCLVIAGNAGEELASKDKRRSFELFRSSLKDVLIITYDELFAKLESLLKLLGV